MRCQATKTAEGWVVPLPEELVAQLGDGPLELVWTDAPDGIWRAHPADQLRQRKQQKQEEILARYRHTLAELSK